MGQQGEDGDKCLVIDKKTEKSSLYFEHEIIRAIDTVKALASDRRNHFIYAKKGNFTSFSHFLDNLAVYEAKRARDFKKSEYKARFGVLFKIMLPKGASVWTDETMAGVAKKIVSFLVGEEKNLGWIALTEKRRNTVFLKIWISDRPFAEYSEPKRYRRNIYIDPVKRSFCKKECPGAVLTHRKGEIILNDDGTPRVEKAHFYPRKSRLFVYPTKDAFEKFCELVKREIINIILSLKMGFGVRKEMVIRRKKLTKIWNPSIRRATVANNRARAYIQTTFNAVKADLSSMFPVDPAAYVFGYGESPHILPSELSDFLNSVFTKYRKAFDEDRFFYDDAEIRLFGGAPQQVEDACVFLTGLFDKDMRKAREIALEHTQKRSETIEFAFAG